MSIGMPQRVCTARGELSPGRQRPQRKSQYGKGFRIQNQSIKKKGCCDNSKAVWNKQSDKTEGRVGEVVPQHVTTWFYWGPPLKRTRHCGEPYGGHADGCGGHANGCGHRHNFPRTQPHPQTPKWNGNPRYAFGKKHGPVQASGHLRH